MFVKASNYILLLLLLMQNISYSQLTKIPKYQLKIKAGPSVHGSGDLSGIMYGAGYSHHFKKNMYLSIGFDGSIHHGQEPLFFSTPDGVARDGSIRSTTSGVQIITGLGFDIVRKLRHGVTLEPGALFRYQSSSHYDEVIVYYPAATGIPFPVLVFNHAEPQNSFSAGLNLQVAYNYYNLKNYSIGIFGAFQFDTNGDNIRRFGISLGKRF